MPFCGGSVGGVGGSGLVLLRPGSAAAVGGLLEAVAVAVHGEDADVVGEPVEECACQALGTERLGPFVERQVAGDQRRAAFVALRDQLEQQFCAGLFYRGTNPSSSMMRSLYPAICL